MQNYYRGKALLLQFGGIDLYNSLVKKKSLLSLQTFNTKRTTH